MKEATQEHFILLFLPSFIFCFLFSLRGSAVLVKCLISLGARLDEYGETGVLPIHVACIDGNLEVVKELIRQHKSAGLDIDSRVSGFLNV